MKKAFSLVALLLSGLFLLSSCAMTPTSRNPLSELITEVSTSITINPDTGEERPSGIWDSGTMSRILEAFPDVAISDLTSHSWENMKDYIHPDLRIHPTMMVLNTDLVSMNLCESVEMLLSVEKNTVAAVYRVKGKGLPDALLCILFHNAKQDGEFWVPNGHYYFFPLTGPKRYADFSFVQEGDPIEKLYSIDSSARYDEMQLKEAVNPMPSNLDLDSLSTEEREKYELYWFIKSLTDGVLYVEYNERTRSITKMSFYPTEENTHKINTPYSYTPYSFGIHDASFLTPLFS